MNLVDWSPNNVLAVGLGNCVYLWNACSSKVGDVDVDFKERWLRLELGFSWFLIVQVTKLCDLGEDDSVCSVSWAQRGTHLSVGTNLGHVQVSCMIDFSV